MATELFQKVYLSDRISGHRLSLLLHSARVVSTATWACSYGLKTTFQLKAAAHLQAAAGSYAKKSLNRF